MVGVSVIIPFHNRVEWTKKSIQSVLSQTFQDFELIIVDDGSSVDCEGEIRNLDGRILYVRQEQKGASAARNLGLRLSTGEYIAFLDSDDIFLPPKLKAQYEVMKKYPHIALSHTSYTLMNENEVLGETVSSGLFTGQVYPNILAYCPIATPTVMLRRDAVQGIYFNEDVTVAEDILFWAEISALSEVVGINDPLTLVRLHGQNAAHDHEKQILGITNLIKFGVSSHVNISRRAKKHILCELYAHMSALLFEKKEYLQGAQVGVKAFLLWPEFFIRMLILSPRYYFYKIIRKILPVRVRKYISSSFDSFLIRSRK